MEKDPSFWTVVMNALAVSAVWLFGEGGRMVVAGSAGGFVNWVTTEKRRLRDGIIAVTGGALSGTYLWPLVLAALNLFLDDLEVTPHNIAMSAFIAGAAGMSILKIITAVVEARLEDKTHE